MYVVSGPVLNRIRERIGPGDVSVPARYFKVVLDYDANEGAAFILPNGDPEEELSDYVVTIDEVEDRTGVDFFYSIPEYRQSQFESQVARQEWRITASGGGGGGYQPANHYTNASDKININAASSAKLQRLYGIGPATARNIIQARPYRTVADLKQADGIGPATLNKIENYIKAGPEQAPTPSYQNSGKLNLNEASRADLKALDGIGTVLSKRIIRNRPYQRVGELRQVKGIGPKTLQGLRSEVIAR